MSPGARPHADAAVRRGRGRPTRAPEKCPVTQTAGEFAHVVRTSAPTKCLLMGVHFHLRAHARVGRGSREHSSDEPEAFAANFRAYSGLNCLVESEVCFKVAYMRAIVGTTQEFFRKAEERVIYTHDSTQFPFQSKMKNLKRKTETL